MLETISQFWGQYGGLLLEGTRDTLIMVLISTLFAYVIGLPLGVLLSITQPHGIWPHKWLNRILGWIINVGRSLPFIILMIAIMPFTKALVGTKIGVPGAIVPLVVSAAPFIARMVETSLAEVDAGVVEAAQSMGASNLRLEGLSARSRALSDPGRVHLHHHPARLHRHRRCRRCRWPGRPGHSLWLPARRDVHDGRDRHLHHHPGAGDPIRFQLAVHEAGQASEINFILSYC